MVKTFAGDGFQTLRTGGGLLRLMAGGAGTCMHTEKVRKARQERCILAGFCTRTICIERKKHIDIFAEQ